MPCPLLIFSQLIDPDCWYKFTYFTYFMANSADPDQLASSESNWSRYTMFAKAGFSRTRVIFSARVIIRVTNNKYMHVQERKTGTFLVKQTIKMMIRCFTSLSTLFKSYPDGGWQWKALCYEVSYSHKLPPSRFEPRISWSQVRSANHGHPDSQNNQKQLIWSPRWDNRHPDTYLSMPVASPCSALCQWIGRYSTRPIRLLSTYWVKWDLSRLWEIERKSSTENKCKLVWQWESWILLLAVW